MHPIRRNSSPNGFPAVQVSDYKGIGAVFVRSLVRSKGGSEARLLANLEEGDRTRYEVLVATDWIPIDFATRLFVLAAPLVHPSKAQAIRLLGRDLALDNLRGPYKYVARILTIPFLLEQAATLWRTYHRRGRGHTERLDGKCVDFIVEDYPGLPERFRECMCGWISGAVELAGARGSVITKTDDTPEAWRWNIRWF